MKETHGGHSSDARDVIDLDDEKLFDQSGHSKARPTLGGVEDSRWARFYAQAWLVREELTTLHAFGMQITEAIEAAASSGALRMTTESEPESDLDGEGGVAGEDITGPGTIKLKSSSRTLDDYPELSYLQHVEEPLRRFRQSLEQLNSVSSRLNRMGTKLKRRPPTRPRGLAVQLKIPQAPSENFGHSHAEDSLGEPSSAPAPANKTAKPDRPKRKLPWDTSTSPKSDRPKRKLPRDTSATSKRTKRQARSAKNTVLAGFFRDA